MEPWVLPLAAIAVVALLEGVVLVVVLHRLGALYSWLDGGPPLPPEQAGLSVGSPAPAFAGTDQLGSHWSDAGLRGQSYLLVLVHPGCKYCRTVLPLLEVAEEEHRGQVRVLLATSVDPRNAQRFASELNTSLPLLTLEADDVKTRFGTGLTPFAFAIDSVGVVRARGVVRDSSRAVGDLLRPLLSKHRPSTPVTSLAVSPRRA